MGEKELRAVGVVSDMLASRGLGSEGMMLAGLWRVKGTAPDNGPAPSMRPAVYVREVLYVADKADKVAISDLPTRSMCRTGEICSSVLPLFRAEKTASSTLHPDGYCRRTAWV